MEKAKNPRVEIATVNNLSVFDGINETLIDQINNGEYFVSDKSAKTVILKNSNFTKNLINVFAAYGVLLAGIVLLGLLLIWFASNNILNTSMPVLGMFIILYLFLLVRSIWVLSNRIVFRTNKIFSVNLIGLRKILLSSDQQFVMVQQSGRLLFDEVNNYESSNKKDSKVDLKPTEWSQTQEKMNRFNHNVISFRNTNRQIESMNLMIIYNPKENHSKDIAHHLLLFIQEHYRKCTYVNEV